MEAFETWKQKVLRCAELLNCARPVTEASLQAWYAENLTPTNAALKAQLQEKDGSNWSEKVKTKWHSPAGLFKKNGGKIARTLLGASHSTKQAMARLEFYKNRAGENLPPERKAALDKAQRIIHKHSQN